MGQFDRGQGTTIYSLTNDLDRAVGALVEDLRASGDLESTLIVMMGEFGRTPNVLNSRGGRDHYRNVMSVAMLGGGVVGGRVIGGTSATGSDIIETGGVGNVQSIRMILRRRSTRRWGLTGPRGLTIHRRDADTTTSTGQAGN